MNKAAAYYGRLMSTAAHNTINRTQVGLSVAAYILVGLGIGLFLYQRQYGLAAMNEQWHAAVMFVLLGPAIAWFFGFILCCATAPLQLYLEDDKTHTNEMQSQAKRFESDKEEVLAEMRAVVADRDDLRRRMDSVPATIGDIQEVMLTFGREARRMSGTATSWVDCAEWCERARRAVTLCLRRQQREDFEDLMPNPIPNNQDATRQRMHTIGMWFHGWNGKLDDRTINSGLTKRQIADLDTPA